MILVETVRTALLVLPLEAGEHLDPLYLVRSPGLRHYDIELTLGVSYAANVGVSDQLWNSCPGPAARETT